jgi:Tol biopolymer transport system component
LFVALEDRIGRFDLASRRVQNIHRDPRGRRIRELAVSPDGRWFAIKLLDKQQNPSLEVLPATGGSAREVFSTTQPDRFLLQDWTRDGANLLISRGRDDEGSIYIRGDWSVWSVPVNGGQPRSLNLTGPRLRGLTVNLDGSQLAYRVGDPGTDEWIMRNFLP